MRLVGQYDSPFVRRVAVALNEYGLPYEHLPWSVWADETQLAKLTPLRRVPVLMLDDGQALIESSAILDSLDELVSLDRALLPRTGMDRRQGLQVCALASGLADKAVSLLYEHVLRAPEHRNERWAKRCTSQIGETLALLEKQRASKASAFWLGERISHADIAVGCTLRFTREAHPERFSWSSWPALAAHAERCEARESFQRAVQALAVTL